MMFSTSPSITRSTSVPGMVPGDDRPPFVTFNKEGGFYISPEKEQRFQEWKKKNEKRMKELNVRPRVFEYVSRPMVVQQRPPVKQKTPTRIRKLAPISKVTPAADGVVNPATGLNGSGSARRKKRLTKTRQKSKSTAVLTKIVDSSSEEGDSGVSVKKSDDSSQENSAPRSSSSSRVSAGVTRSRSTDLALRNRTSAQQLPPTTPKDAFRSPEKSAESKRRKKSKRRSSKSERAGPMVQKEADFERRIMKELIAEVIEQSITEVTNEEERHHVAVAMSPQLTVAVA